MANSKKKEAHKVTLDSGEEAKKIETEMLRASGIAAASAMASSFAHQINTPLQIIMSNAGVLRDILSDNKRTEKTGMRNVDNIIYSVSKIKEIIDHLNRLVKGHSEEEDWVNLSTAIDNAFQLFSDQLRNRKVKVQLEIPDTTQDIKVLGNFTKLEQVFINLIANARDAIASRPNPEIKLEVVSQVENSKVVVRFSDNGVGISKDNQKNVFKPLFSTKDEGVGLGLWLCNTVIEQMQGSIEMESEVNVGTLFTITLPTKNLKEYD